jgi:MoaA/NifB/PqqE/SkfB family radical SAM enzyme
MIGKAILARMRLGSYPLALTWETTWRCTLACRYCDRHTPMPRELTREQIFKALEEFAALGMVETNLDGGEALVHPHIAEIVDWLVAHGVRTSMHTNGMAIPKRLHTVRKLSSVKISLDGPRDRHDSMRGAGSFDWAMTGAAAARSAGVAVEFTCTVGRHNVDALESLVEMCEGLGYPVVFQPATNSLFLDEDRDGSAWTLERESVVAGFARLERLKLRGRAVGNRWSSLRHFRHFPFDTRPPCAAGWVTCTMDPEGVLFPCGQVNRRDRSNSIVTLGVAAAFANLHRGGCGQCWCARLVEGNYAWGMRLDRMMPPVFQ